MPSQGRNRKIEFGFLIYREAFQKRDVYKMGRDGEENQIQTIGENCFINVYEFVNVISFVGERKHPTNLKMSYRFSCLCYIRSTLRQEDRVDSKPNMVTKQPNGAVQQYPVLNPSKLEEYCRL